MSRFDGATAVACPAVAQEPFWAGPVSEYPQFDYSMKDVLRAGESLATKLLWTDETAPRIREVFSIASNWRDSHAYPMRKVRNQVHQNLRRLKLTGGNTVARLKHMPSIRRKLRDQPWKLNQMQDLAGCRAILPNIQGVNELIETLQRSDHAVYREYPYITSPKKDGYRCHHFVVNFKGVGEEEVFNGRRVEIQVRTRLQHSWATAVETVGLFRKENMKAGLGSAEWLRLFKLMSAEFAIEEGCPEPADASGGDARIREIVELDKALNAANTLDTLSYAVKYVNTYVQDPESTADYFLIRYDSESRVVSVQSQYGAKLSVQSYDDAEFDAYKAGPQKRAVLVEADNIESLYSAYPNYFGDVQIFKVRLKMITQGAGAVEYSLPAQQTVPRKPREKPDLSWLRSYKRWK